MSVLSQLVSEIFDILKKNNWQLVTAESCTGGLIASYLTDIPGSSSWFERGFVTYSNLAKEEMLAVPHQLIEKYGAVSRPVVQAMALGALQNKKGKISIAVTGIAGPGGGSVAKPIGTVYFGWAALGIEPKTLKKKFDGTRQEIRLAACQEALSGALLFLKSLKFRT